MEIIQVVGGNRLVGDVFISGAKNAVVAILPAAILAEDVCRIENIPEIADVTSLLNIIQSLGVSVKYINKNTIEIDSRKMHKCDIAHDLTKHLRASYYFIGALLSRFGSARVSMPGGCNFGVRPIDQHIKGFNALGAQVLPLEDGMLEVVSEKLVGNQIFLDVVSVGATINIMLASVRAQGLTVIENAAREPHIVDLANFLNSMGADVRGAGTDVIKIRGIEKLHGTTYSIIPDQIEAGTYMVAAAATGGNVVIRNVIPKHLESISAKLSEMGVTIEEYDDAVRVSRTGPLKFCNVKTMPHPGFPTDMQPQMSVLLALAKGTSILTESVWEDRFRYVDELRRMGVNAQVDGKVAVFQGVEHLTGAPVKATDLRGGIAVVIAGLVAQGTTKIEDINHIQRGYDNIVDKLANLGANICYVNLNNKVMPKVFA